MLATCWKVLVRTGFESRWGRISVAVPVAYLAMLLVCDWLAGGLSEQTQHQPLARHAAMDMSAIGWVMIANSSNCLISQEWLASIAEDDSIINATLHSPLPHDDYTCIEIIVYSHNTFSHTHVHCHRRDTMLPEIIDM